VSGPEQRLAKQPPPDLGVAVTAQWTSSITRFAAEVVSAIIVVCTFPTPGSRIAGGRIHPTDMIGILHSLASAVVTIRVKRFPTIEHALNNICGANHAARNVLACGLGIVDTIHPFDLAWHLTARSDDIWAFVCDSDPISCRCCLPHWNCLSLALCETAL
jgi:hypothetical protein